jgi:hypothetical protein
MKMCATMLLLLAVSTPVCALVIEDVTEEELARDTALLKAVFPNEEIKPETVTGEGWHYTAIRINPEYRVDLPKRHIMTCLLATEANGDKILVVAVELDPPMDDPSYPMKKRIVLAIVRERDGAFSLLHKAEVPLPGDEVGKTQVKRLEGLRSVAVQGRTMVLFEYGSLPLTTPGTYLQFTNLIDFTESYEPRVVWAEETKYGDGGSGYPGISSTLKYTFVKDRDGDDMIAVEKTTVEEGHWVWDGAKFVKANRDPPQWVKQRLKEQRKEEQKND